MWHKESERKSLQKMEAKTNGSAAAAFEMDSVSTSSQLSESTGLVPQGAGEEVETSYSELLSDTEDGKSGGAGSPADRKFKIMMLTLCFAGTCTLTVAKGGGHLRSPLGFECGS